MNEQLRPKEVLNQFPKIPNGVVIEFMENSVTDGFDYAGIEGTMREKDPHLWEAIELMGSECGHQNCKEASLIGGSIIFTLFESIKDQGVLLHPVSEGVVTTYLSEVEIARRVITRVSEAELRTRHDEIHERAKGLEFNFPSPIQYAEENPSLMVLMAEYLDPQQRFGGMVVYELKRRQFFANQLKKQFGE